MRFSVNEKNEVKLEWEAFNSLYEILYVAKP